MDAAAALSRSWKDKGFALGAEAPGIELWAHAKRGYALRTVENARACATMAAAADYSTGGERLTKKAAARRYIMLPFYLEPEEAGERLACFMSDREARSLNIAGNGIATLEAKGMTQAESDLWMLRCLRKADGLRRIPLARSGGQTGVDMSGACAALALGIPARILFPQGFLQRGADGVDRSKDPLALLAELQWRAAEAVRSESSREPLP